jgi:hypothetical protein
MPRKLIPDDEADARIEKLVRTKSRLEHTIKDLKAKLDGATEELLVELKKHPKRAYVRGAITAYVELKEKVFAACTDETGETE